MGLARNAGLASTSKNHPPSPHAPQVRLLQQNRSKADIGLPPVDVRFTPKSGHGSAELGQGKMVPVPPPCCRRTNTRSTSMVGREHREDHCPAIIPVGISGLDRGMSALPPKADMAQHRCDVRFVPKADISVVPRTQ